MEPLQAYAWPGNVRELANVIERAKILAEGPSITLRDLPSGIVQPIPAARDRGSSAGTAVNKQSHLDELERQHVQRILSSHGGNKARAARALGISRRKLYRLLEKHGLEDSA